MAPMTGNNTMEKSQARKLLYQLMLIRRFEEKAAEMYTKSQIRGFLHLYIGEEAVAVGVMDALSPDDNVLCTYREHGQALVRGVDAGAIMAEMYGKQEGCCRGRGGSMHLFDVTRKFFGGNAIVAGHLPMALGFALTEKKLKKNSITVCFFGEGAAAEGAFHESMNLAALWKIPLLFVCENNLYAMGTAIRFTHAVTELEKKGMSYGIPCRAVDGMDVRAVLQATNYAIDSIRKNGNPFFLVCNTYRFRAHSMFDAELYRDKSEVEEWKKRDPILLFKKYATEHNLITGDEISSLQNQIEDEVDKAVRFAEAGAWEPVEQLTRFVYSENNKINHT